MPSYGREREYPSLIGQNECTWIFSTLIGRLDYSASKSHTECASFYGSFRLFDMLKSTKMVRKDFKVFSLCERQRFLERILGVSNLRPIFRRKGKHKSRKVRVGGATI